MRIRFKEKNGELYLFTEFFDLKLTRLRQVMIRNTGENFFNIVEGVESPKGSALNLKKHFLLHIAYGVHYKIEQDSTAEKQQPKQEIDTEENNDIDE